MQSHVLDTIDAQHVEVDVCTQCRGYVFDFDDGEPSNIARDLQPSLSNVTARVAPQPGTPHCTDCSASMSWMTYLENGPLVARCGECMSMFVPHEYIAELSRVGVETEPAKPLTLRSIVDSIEAQVFAEKKSDSDPSDDSTS